ncbi:MAG: hypothetical protein IJV34_01945 [Prevotella sp.]|nr:hypothetical protein [Prevotella sp.]
MYAIVIVLTETFPAAPETVNVRAELVLPLHETLVTPAPGVAPAVIVPLLAEMPVGYTLFFPPVLHATDMFIEVIVSPFWGVIVKVLEA